MDLSLAKANDPQVMIEFVRRIMEQINTAIPGEIVAFDTDKQTATLKPCIRSVSISQDGTRQDIDLPEIFCCPVWFPYSTTTGFALTYPVVQGDQCLIIFSQKSFDNWLLKGSVQNVAEPSIPRSFDYSDAIALVGLIPNPSAIANFQTDGIELRSKERKAYAKVSNETVKVHGTSVEIDAEASQETCESKTMNISNGLQVSAANTTFNADMNINGSIATNGAAGVSTSVTIDGVTLTFSNGLCTGVG